MPKKMQGIFGKDTTLGSEKLRTVLMMVMRNVDHGLALALV